MTTLFGKACAFILGVSLTVANASEPSSLKCESDRLNPRKLQVTLNLKGSDVRFTLDGNLFVFGPTDHPIRRTKANQPGSEEIRWTSHPYSWSMEVVSSDLQMARGNFQSGKSSIPIRCDYLYPEVSTAWSKRFHEFVCQGEVDLAQLLLESNRSFDINWIDPATHETALDCTSKSGNPALRKLLARSADFGREDATASRSAISQVAYEAPIGPLPLPAQPSPTDNEGPFEFPDIRLPVEDAQTRSFTREWRLTEASSHWPTLSAQVPTHAIPLVSNNSALMIASARDTELQPQTGIVLGKVPKGWSVAISGRSERPTYFGTDNQLAAPETTELDRYFVFVNTAPGTQTLQLIDGNSVTGGMITLPVLSATATYVDLVSASYRSVSGFILDAAIGRRSPLKAARVQIMGQPGSAVWTDRRGRFELEKVLVSDALPIQIDIQAAMKNVQTRVHRFSMNPDQFSGQDYYLFSEGDLRDWEETLQGTLNPDSGMVIGAAPGIAGMMSHAFASLSSFTGLPPQVYSLAPSGQMIEKAPLDSDLPRFVSMEVAEGPTIAKILDDSGQTFSSRLFYTSPRTVNILSIDAR